MAAECIVDFRKGEVPAGLSETVKARFEQGKRPSDRQGRVKVFVVLRWLEFRA